jgi:hypothetical protein
LEAGVDLLTIGRLLGHRSFSSTLIYLHVRRPHLDSMPSPLDWLPVEQCPRFTEPANKNQQTNNRQEDNTPPASKEPQQNVNDSQGNGPKRS